jgi:hypothetical protein
VRLAISAKETVLDGDPELEGDVCIDGGKRRGDSADDVSSSIASTESVIVRLVIGLVGEGVDGSDPT